MPRLNPPLPIVGSTIMHLVVETLIDSQRCMTDFHYINANPNLPASNEETLFIAAWRAACETTYLACLSTDALLTTYKAEELSDLTRQGNEIFGLSLAGTASSTHIPLEMAQVITIQTSVKGQHGRGRVFMPGVPSSFVSPLVNPNGPNPAGITAYVNLVNALETTLTVGASSYRLGVTTKPIPWGNFTRARVWDILYVRSPFGTQRRRRPGRGI